MRLPISAAFLLLLLPAIPASAAEPASPQPAPRRIFDVTPPSEANPILVRIPSCGIELPVSEFTAYVAAEGAPMMAPAAGPLGLEEKKRLVQQLVDEHLLLWTAYEKKANEAPGYVQAMANTRHMLLAEALEAQDVAAKASTPEEHARLASELKRQLFESAEIIVSTEVYEDLKAAQKKLRPATAAKEEAAQSDPLAGVPNEVAGRVLARWNDTSITVADTLASYLDRPAAERPDLGKPEGLIQLLREMLEPALMVAEAKKRGLESSPSVQEKIVLNSSALLRFHVQDEITAEAVRRKDAPGLDGRLKQWYGAQLKTRYTITDDKGITRVLRLEDEKERVENDYFEFIHLQVRAEKLQSLRDGREIHVDDKLLAATPVTIPVIGESDSSLPTSVMTWDADTREQTIAEGDKTLTFKFDYVNVSTADVVIHEFRPSCDCTTVKEPTAPAVIKAGERGTLEAVVDLRGKRESYTRTLTVGTNRGDKLLNLKIVAPAK